MNDRIKNFLDGIGSIVDICPDTSKYAHLVPGKSQEERMKQAWETTGRQIRDAAGQFSDEQTKKKHSNR